MSEALPALAFRTINSVSALLGSPLPEVRSRISTPVGRTEGAGEEGWGKRAASNFRRSTTVLADMLHSDIRGEYVQANISPLIETCPIVFSGARVCGRA